MQFEPIRLLLRMAMEKSISAHSTSNKPLKLFRGNLKRSHDLVELFKMLDKYTVPQDRNLPYTKRRYVQGTKKLLAEHFNVDVKTIFDPKKGRIADNPNGLTDASKIKRGVSSDKLEKWEAGATFEAIKNHTECWDYELNELTRKGKTYNTPLFRTWEITKYDPLDYDLATWEQFWGKAKAKGTGHPLFRDGETGRVSYANAVAFRFAMARSHAPDVKDLISSKDARFTTDDLKRDKGKHKEEYQSEAQIVTLPEFIENIDTLMLDYCGILFGGRFSALKNLSPADISRETRIITLYESKIDTDVEKAVFEPELGFIYRYVMDFMKTKTQKLFPRSITKYNEELTNAGKAMGIKYPNLMLLDKKGEEWSLTTHRGFKHTCITQMSLHGVRSDTISDYVHTDPNTIREFYRGGSKENIDAEIGGIEIKKSAPTWRAFVIHMTKAFEKRYNELVEAQRAGITAQKVPTMQARA